MTEFLRIPLRIGDLSAARLPLDNRLLRPLQLKIGEEASRFAVKILNGLFQLGTWEIAVKQRINRDRDETNSEDWLSA